MDTPITLPIQNDPTLPRHCPNTLEVLPGMLTEFVSGFSTVVKGEICAAEARGQAYTDEVVRDLQATVDGINDIDGLNEKLATAVKLFQELDENGDGKALDDLDKLREMAEKAAKAAESAASDAASAKQTTAEVLAELGELKSQYADALINTNGRIDELSDTVSTHAGELSDLRNQVENLPDPGVSEAQVAELTCKSHSDLMKALEKGFAQGLAQATATLQAACPVPGDTAPQA